MRKFFNSVLSILIAVSAAVTVSYTNTAPVYAEDVTDRPERINSLRTYLNVDPGTNYENWTTTRKTCYGVNGEKLDKCPGEESLTLYSKSDYVKHLYRSSCEGSDSACTTMYMNVSDDEYVLMKNGKWLSNLGETGGQVATNKTLTRLYIPDFTHYKPINTLYSLVGKTYEIPIMQVDHVYESNKWNYGTVGKGFSTPDGMGQQVYTSARDVSKPNVQYDSYGNVVAYSFNTILGAGINADTGWGYRLNIGPADDFENDKLYEFNEYNRDTSSTGNNKYQRDGENWYGKCGNRGGGSIIGNAGVCYENLAGEKTAIPSFSQLTSLPVKETKFTGYAIENGNVVEKSITMEGIASTTMVVAVQNRNNGKSDENTDVDYLSLVERTYSFSNQRKDTDDLTVIYTPTYSKWSNWTTSPAAQLSSSAPDVFNKNYTVRKVETITIYKYPKVYTVQYNGNGATSGSMPNSTFSFGVSSALPANAFKKQYTLNFNLNGGAANAKFNPKIISYNFTNWLKQTTNEVFHDKESSVAFATADSPIAKLNAQWGNPTVITLETPSKPGSRFIGWTTSADGSGTMLLPGDGVTVNKGGNSSETGMLSGVTVLTADNNNQVTLYAQWLTIEPVLAVMGPKKVMQGTGLNVEKLLSYDSPQNVKADDGEGIDISQDVIVTKIQYANGTVVQDPNGVSEDYFLDTNTVQNITVFYKVTNSYGNSAVARNTIQVMTRISPEDPVINEVTDVEIYERYIDEEKTALNPKSIWNTNNSYKTILDGALDEDAESQRSVEVLVPER